MFKAIEGRRLLESGDFRVFYPSNQGHEGGYVWALALSMAIHELGTNASKYGALSTPQGNVSLTWNCSGDGNIRIEWVERGGPEVVKPRRFGVGSRLLQAYGPLRAVDVEYFSDGVRCRIKISAAA